MRSGVQQHSLLQMLKMMSIQSWRFLQWILNRDVALWPREKIIQISKIKKDPTLSVRDSRKERSIATSQFRRKFNYTNLTVECCWNWYRIVPKTDKNAFNRHHHQPNRRVKSRKITWKETFFFPRDFACIRKWFVQTEHTHRKKDHIMSSNRKSENEIDRLVLELELIY